MTDFKKYPDDFPEYELEVIKEQGSSGMKAIRKKCKDCSCGSDKEIRLCPVKTCPLYPFRMGKGKGALRTILDEKRENESE